MRGEHLNCEPSPLAPLAPLLRGPLKTLTVILNQFLDDPSWLVPAPALCERGLEGPATLAHHCHAVGKPCLGSVPWNPAWRSHENPPRVGMLGWGFEGWLGALPEGLNKKSFSHEAKYCRDNSRMPATWQSTAAFLTWNFIHMSK